MFPPGVPAVISSGECATKQNPEMPLPAAATHRDLARDLPGIHAARRYAQIPPPPLESASYYEDKII